MKPTVLSDVDRADPIVQEEIFGPVLVVLQYEGDDDAVAAASHSIYGLAGAVWATDRDRALAV
ncbi:aldehyde dehydrogenase family protein [Rhodococcus sp. WS3]|nr:aldehyde dehydrogenase family protein [Rhodococcus sp. WS3]